MTNNKTNLTQSETKTLRSIVTNLRTTDHQKEFHLTKDLAKKLSKPQKRTKELREIVGILIFGIDPNAKTTRIEEFKRLEMMLKSLYDMGIEKIIGLDEVNTALDRLEDVNEFLVWAEIEGVEFDIEYKEVMLLCLFSEFGSLGEFDDLLGEGMGICGSFIDRCRMVLKGYLNEGKKIFFC